MGRVKIQSSENTLPLQGKVQKRRLIYAVLQLHAVWKSIKIKKFMCNEGRRDCSDNPVSTCE